MIHIFAFILQQYAPRAGMQQPPQYTITTSQPGTVNITANAPPFQYNPYPNAAAAAPHTANASKSTSVVINSYVISIRNHCNVA